MSQHQADLFNKLLNGKLTSDEAETLVSWLGTGKLDAEAEELIKNQLQQNIESNAITPELQAALEDRLPQILANKKPVVLMQQQWLRYAAAIIVIIGAAILFFVSQKTVPQKSVSIAQTEAFKVNDVQPGKQGAVLTLADGRTIVLDSLQNGVVATQNGSNILLNNGQLTYDKHSVDEGEIAYNVIATPRGRQFQLVLSDGTKVWLNAASSLRYPTVFTGNERKVEITGEAYFEVAKNKKLPFKVSINNETEVEVLGTHFNINSYSNESSINTTLLEGSVKVNHGKQALIITPGQQAQVSGDLKVVSGVNLTRVMAWKNGVFDFENARLEEIMRQLERWYDVDVVYEKGIPTLEFFGKMGRDLSLSNVLRGLEMSKVHFRLEGKKLVVLP